MKHFTCTLLLFYFFISTTFAEPSNNAVSKVATNGVNAPIVKVDKSTSNTLKNGGDNTTSEIPRTCDQMDIKFKESIEPIVISRLSQNESPIPPKIIHMGDWLTIDIPEDKYFHFTMQGNNTSPTPVLYLNHIAISGLEWLPGSCNSITFHLTRTNESRNIFGVLLKHGGNPINVGIGTTQDGFITDIAKVQLELASNTSRITWIVGILAFIFGTIYLAAKTDLLRDIPKANHTSQKESLPFSLARVQMAWWFVLTVFAFSGIWFITGDLSSIPSSILGLMGISSATTIMSAVIDTTNENDAINSQKTQGLLLDILTDNGRVSFHRFQMLIWTILLGGIFFHQVWNSLSMPDFDSQLLGLMGVASGTYLGFKIPIAGK